MTTVFGLTREQFKKISKLTAKVSDKSEHEINEATHRTFCIQGHWAQVMECFHKAKAMEIRPKLIVNWTRIHGHGMLWLYIYFSQKYCRKLSTMQWIFDTCLVKVVRNKDMRNKNLPNYVTALKPQYGTAVKEFTGVEEYFDWLHDYANKWYETYAWKDKVSPTEALTSCILTSRSTGKDKVLDSTRGLSEERRPTTRSNTKDETSDEIELPISKKVKKNPEIVNLSH